MQSHDWSSGSCRQRNDCPQRSVVARQSSVTEVGSLAHSVIRTAIASITGLPLDKKARLGDENEIFSYYTCGAEAVGKGVIQRSLAWSASAVHKAVDNSCIQHLD